MNVKAGRRTECRQYGSFQVAGKLANKQKQRASKAQALETEKHSSTEHADNLAKPNLNTDQACIMTTDR